MIDWLIGWSLKNRLLVASATLFVIVFGLRALYETPVDALPDLSENQVIVYADWPGRSPREVEDQMTHPLSVKLQGISGVKAVRAASMFGFSLITVIFEDQITGDLARQRVLERLSFLGDSLPAGVTAKLGPDATGLGWIYQYYLGVDQKKSPNGRGYDLGELRSLQDWFLRSELNGVPGVAEVASVGGFVRQYQIEVDSEKMRAVGISLEMVMSAVSRSNLNVGGKTIEENGMEFVVRGVGLIRSAADLEKIVLMEKNGVPILLSSVARIDLGGDFRRGVLDVEGREVVGGTVVLRTGANARAVIAQVKAKLARLASSLPPGITIQPFYDRSELIDRTLDTLKHALVQEVLLVTLAHIIFLFHFRSILIVTIPLPVSVLVSFILMRELGVGSNIMSLSGLAIAIGVLVDAAIVLTENVLRRCGEATQIKGSALTSDETLGAVLAASKQVGRPIFFAMAVIVAAFLPVFALTGQEGKLFHPLAFTKTSAMIGSALAAMTLVPVLCSWFVRGPFQPENRNVAMRFLLKLYDPALRFALNHRKLVVSAAALILAVSLALIPRLGSELVPPLNEGSLLFMPTFAPATALTEVKRVMAWQDQVIHSFPEVVSAVGKLGRADTATDPAPTEMVETTIMLKPERDWRPGLTRSNLIAEMTEALRQAPGCIPGFLQPIEGRVLMISTGLRAQLGAKIFGDDLHELQGAAVEALHLIQSVPGASGAAASRVSSKPYLEVEVNRQALANYGVGAQDVLDVVEAGFGGKDVTTAIEGRNRIPIQVRLQRNQRDDLTRLKDALVTAPPSAIGQPGRVIPLGQLAEIRRVEGPSEIASENGRLRSFVQANVAGRDLGSFVEEVKRRMQRELVPKLAARGMTIEYSGEYENQLHAARTLKLIVPAVLLIIFLLLHTLYRSAVEAAHVILAVPFAMSGGLFLQFALGFPWSVAVWVGYIALFGTAIQTAVVMVVYLDEAVQRKRQERGAAFSHADLIQAVKEGARLRLRPKVMTVATIVASLLPIFWSHGAGAEVMRPLAAPIIGGMLSSLLHILIVTPALFLWLRAGSLKLLPITDK